MTRYDFSETADFLNYSVPLGDLYDDVVFAMHSMGEYRYLTREDVKDILSVLLTCADFIDTIKIK